MKIGFIGAGRVGTSLGRYFAENGFSISGYFSRNKISAKHSVEIVNIGSTKPCRIFEDIISVVRSSDIIFITVSDSAIIEVAENIKVQCDNNSIDLGNKIFCHTSGAMSSKALSPLESSNIKAVSLHMLLAICDKENGYKALNTAFFTIEGESTDTIENVVKACGNKYTKISAENKTKYHAAAVFASNFVVALSDISCNILTECGFEYKDALSAIAPLIKGNTENIISQGPKDALTGPVERGDFSTVRNHILDFKDSDIDVMAKKVYCVLTEALIQQTKNKPDTETENLLNQ